MNLLSGVRGRRILFGALYMSEGAPIGFIWWALPTLLRAEGVDVATITSLTSLLVFPWIFKFVWAPLIDTVQTSRWSIRSWIITMQFLMGATLLPLFFIDVRANPEIIVLFLLAHAVVAATQDAAIDSLAIRTVPERERGSINGWMQAGMLAGRSLLGGGTLVLVQHVGEQAVLILLIAVIYASSVLLLLAPIPDAPAGDTLSVRDAGRSFLSTLRIALRSRTTWLGLLFAGTAGAAYEAVGAVAGPFLIDRGFTKEEVGTFFALPSVLCMMAGSLAGGYFTDRIGKQKAVTVFLLVMIADVVALAQTHDMENSSLLWVLLSLLYLCIGLFVAASYAMFMDITDPRLGATQFSAFMGATNGCESWSSLAVGRLVGVGGYPLGFMVMSGVTLLAIPVVRFLKQQKENGHAP